MAWKSAVVLILMLMPAELARGAHWRGIDLAGEVSIPSLLDARNVEWGSGGSLVRVKHLKRIVRKEKKVYDGSPGGSHLVPVVAELEYRVEEVFAGDDHLKGRIASATAIVLHGFGHKSRAKGIVSDCMPEEDDEGIWLERIS